MTEAGMEIPIIFITGHGEGFFRAWIAMGVELRPNGNAREGRASVWIFSGRSIVYLVVGAAMGPDESICRR
jgi:hypothetical protein